MKRLLAKLTIFILVYVLMLMLIIVTLCWVGAEYVIEGVVHTSKVDGYVAGILSCQLTFELFRLDKELGREKDA